MSLGADYIVLLNNDTRVEPDWVEALVAAAEADSSIAVCQSQLRTWDGQHEIHFRFIPEWAEAETIESPVQIAGPPVPTAFASGCAMLLRCRALEHIGLFDERYFCYVEDLDLTLRAWVLGYKAMLVPESVVYHRGSSSSNSRQRMYWGYRNQLTTLIKLYEPRTLRAFWKPITRRWFCTRNRIALRATCACLLRLPGTLVRRRRLQRQRARPDSEIFSVGDR